MSAMRQFSSFMTLKRVPQLAFISYSCRLQYKVIVPSICIQVSTVEEAAAVISELKGKFRSQGHQIITYRRKLRQQVGG